ncbi:MULTISPECIES: NAD(P)/FAD-dependent oxidoreductase [Burkholderia cepacia complex]|uniref:Pyridine nucleotide-disulfide oxidoreductase n=1 Tax=Burkholderia ubonensis TaxID=101571 RepID=A0A1B4LJD6_9BURK|nr:MULTISPECIES: FAD-dependent oxidoreductase [Burkholderia cepacia complex]AOJ77285.1 pyridine nucleotide-disulfide oxidoreductase [Burkholderia ubonensis]AOK14395.1 pyridine nucleotide-disulfide oxidoreductase [Burkholderia vietnamiensis]
MNQPHHIRIIGMPRSRDAYAIRDFLQRRMVAYDWCELTSDADSTRELGIAPLRDVRLPVVIFPDGSRLYRPTLAEIAARLGWVAQPRFVEYDVSIYGAGPAGLSAAVYAASEGLRAVLIERAAVGGQAGTSSLIENYMGFPDGIPGAELAERAREQAMKFGVELLTMREGVHARFVYGKIHVDLADGSVLVARSNICATGIEYRSLGLPEEPAFLNAGLFYGAGSSEAPMCSGEHVFIVGGGNSAGQAAMNFSRHAREVTMLVRGASLADTLSRYLIDRIERTPNIAVRYRSAVDALYGDGWLDAIGIRTDDGPSERVPATRLFVCIGGAPNTEWAKDTAIIRNSGGYLVTGTDLYDCPAFERVWPLERRPYYLETSVPGSFAAGDVRSGSVKRVASAVGEGAMAVTFVHRFLGEDAHRLA